MIENMMDRVSFFRNLIAACVAFPAACASAADDAIWVEAEQFADLGGWTADTQFVAEMGSAYLLASGAGTPVAPARTSVRVPKAGRWRAWVRTRNWLPEFSPGTFAVEINGSRSKPLGNLRGSGWRWQNAGEFDLPAGDVKIRLLDLTGWFGRCDAIVLKQGDDEPVRPKTKFPAEPTESFDVVVVGGGPAGSSAALAAARAGARTLLVHDRPCVGGNASREIRIAPYGADTTHPNYVPRGILAELRALVPDPDGDWTEAFETLMGAETNLTVVGNVRIVAATTNGIGAITSVRGVDVRSGAPSSWRGTSYVDATGDGWLGFYAGAATERDALSMSGSLVSTEGRAQGHVRGFCREQTDRDQPFAAPPWIYELKADTPPRLANLDGALLEHPYSMDELADGEGTRDELLRMTVSYWNWLKNVSPDRNRPEVRQSRVKSYVTALARREGRRLLGDYVLTEDDELAGRRFPDGVAHGGYPISTHDGRGSFAAAGSSYPRPIPPVYDIPFRSLYSTNVVNLLMAGRCISMTHRALGSVRVEATCAETGEAAGHAAAVCAREGITPRTYGRRLLRLADTRPQTWFHIIDGNLSKDALAADIQAIAEAGIGGIQLFHGGFDGERRWPGVAEAIPCLSAKWSELIAFAADECARHGLWFEMQNCPGWSMSGGPWITPDRAMRKLVAFEPDRKPPFAPDDDFREIGAVTFPCAPRSADGGVSAVTVPNPQQIDHRRAYEPNAVFVISEDDVEVCRRPCPKGAWQDSVGFTFKLPRRIGIVRDGRRPTLRAEVEDRAGRRSVDAVWHAEQDLLDNWEAQAGLAYRSLATSTNAPPVPAGGGASRTLVFGHVNARQRNNPAPKEATGWECDKMDPRGFEAHWRGYLGKLCAGPLGGGRLQGVLVDSWECGVQNWTWRMEDEFQRLNGYALRPWLPALFGHVLESEAATERFLRDWRRTCSRLIEDNYYGTMARLAHENGLVLQFETAFHDVIPGDPLRYWKYADIPMCEFWQPHDNANGFVYSDNFKPVRPCVSAAHIYGKRRVQAEALTSFALTFDEDFNAFKRAIDHHLVRGVTHVVFHTYTHDPRTGANALPPGTSFGGGIGSPFLRRQTWWKFMPKLTDYLTRCGRELERGLPAVDVLWYLGDDGACRPDENAPFPRGYKYDYITQDALLERVSAREGQLVLPDGMSSRLLWIPDGTYLLPETERKLAELEQAGARICRGKLDIDWESPLERLAGRDPDSVLDWYQRRDGDESIFFIVEKTGETRFIYVNGATRTRRVVDASSGRDVPPDEDAPGESARCELMLKPLEDYPPWAVERTYVGTVTSRVESVRRAVIDLGDVRSWAEVSVNGKAVDTLWHAPYRCDIARVLHPGTNTVRVTVTSTWYNRLAHDASLPENARRTWTLAGPRAGSPFRPAGLLGPATLTLFGQTPTIQDVTIREITSRKNTRAKVRVTGFVSNIIRDETDIGWTYLLLKHLSDFVTVRIPSPGGASVNSDALMHSFVQLTGTVRNGQDNIRRYIGPHLELSGMEDVKIVKGPPEIPFTVSPLEDFSGRSPVSIVTAGPRVIVGRVLAAWGGRNILVYGTSNTVHRVELLPGETLPACGSTVQIAGRPTTDTFHIDFTRARCRTISPPKLSEDGEAMKSPAQPLRDNTGRPHISMALHGHLVRFTGVVLTNPDENGRVLLECDGFRVPYDISAEPQLASRLTPESRVSFSGIGLIETDIWHADATFPLVRGFVVIGRSLDDVTVLEPAPWWTPRRLCVVIATLFVVLFALLVWIRLLNRLVEKRGRQLYREEFARSVAVLRTEDRTRLAVELHDSLSQTLTGVALQVDAIALAAEQDPERLTQYVATARRTVDNCRNELKNCLWDLRNQALDESDAAEAVRKTVSPLAGDAVVTIDFGIPRSHFSDLTFHDILRILRELVTNAVRHGNARNIAITGVDGGQAVRFTVKDDGCGFDPSARPGIADGHFGLDGIAERLRRTKGTLSIDSAPGRGTTAVFTLTRSHP